MYVKDFDYWNIVKKKTQIVNENTKMFRERDIWWTRIGVNVGYEEDGKGEFFLRPVLVLRKFNSELFFGVPLTTQVKKNIYYLRILVKKRIVCAMLSQVKVFSSKRLGNRLGTLELVDFNRTKESIKEVLF